MNIWKQKHRCTKQQQQQQTPNSSSAVSGLKTGCVLGRNVFGTLPWQVREVTAALEDRNPLRCGSQALLRRALILILFNSLCLTFNSLQGLSDWRLSKQSWVHPSLELVFCGTSPSSLWALYQFDQICSITGCKHQECFSALLCALAGEICKP